MELAWVRCESDVWCALERVNLSSVTAQGVYVIWMGVHREGTNVVYVGKGDVADRIAYHRRSGSEVLAYRQYGELLVTWASVPETLRDGVEVYLANRFQPLIGTHPNAAPIQVNLPG